MTGVPCRRCGTVSWLFGPLRVVCWACEFAVIAGRLRAEDDRFRKTPRLGDIK